ncbi:hypothetical protein, partial [Catelliglobosispora koreensis]|uniref:hypothetical protein n=1 Tax=Catelliglobosispora koreensis TaxID=129052 RepID=UPI0003668096
MGRHATTATLAEAARLALAAPSIFNTQPWRWVIHGAMLELRADHSRQLRAVDPTGRMLTISCGVALHHAVVALYPHTAEVGLYPDPADPGLLAIVRVSDGDSDRRMTALREAIGVRRTDRRAFGKKPVFGNILDRLAAVCHEQHAHLYQVPWQHMPAFALAAVAAGALQLSDPEYRIELADWTHRPVWSGDGVPVETAAGKQARRVPVRDFAPFGGEET